MVKKGFSLAEALVVMAVISILFGAISKVITTRPKPRKQVNAHGYYECYINGSLKQRYVREGVAENVENVSQCTFKPPVNIAFYNINTYGSTYYSSNEPNINKTLNISVSGSGISISGETLSGNSTETNMKSFFTAIYPDTNMSTSCGSSICTGILISW